MKNFHGAKVAFAHDKQAYSKGLADLTKARFEKMGGKPALYETVNAGERDYSAFVTKLKAQGINALYYGGYHTELGLIVRQLREQGVKAQVLSGDALSTAEFWQITGDSGEGVLFTFAPDPRKRKAANKIVSEFEASGYDPEGYTLYTYAAFQVWADAVKAAQTMDTEKVEKKIKSTQFSTVIGSLAFNSLGDRTTADYTWYKWTKGEYKEVGDDYKVDKMMMKK